METHKLKMERMQVVKIHILLLFIFFCIEGKGQTIKGDFKLINSSTSVEDIGIMYSFEPNGIFRKIIYEHLNKRTISGGNYRIKEDTLILDYKSLKQDSAKNLVYIKKEKLKDSTRFFSNIQILNSKGNPQAGVNLLIKNKDEVIVMGFSSNNEGEYPTLSIYDSYIQYLTFSFLGHQEISINTDSLFGLNTKIRVQLESSSVSYTNTTKSLRYLFKQHNDSLSLIPLNGNNMESLILKKMPKLD
jgi:hypothetical protein